MDAKESLKILLDVLHELKKQHITRQMLIDLIRGVESREITDAGLDDLEIFGIGDKREELHYNMVIDQAIDEKFIKCADSELVITQKGERFRKAPVPFVLKEDEDNEDEPKDDDNEMLDILVESALNDDKETDEEELSPITPTPATHHSQQMIHLIQAIDRKIPLDDYAEQMQLGFDEVLDNCEALVRQGVKIDLTYFVDEVLEKDCQQELFDYFASVKGDVNKAIEEFDGAYQPEEVRLARLVWKD